MATLVINDLVESKELDRAAMAGVYGGEHHLGHGFGSATILLNHVANIKKGFAFDQSNLAALTNYQAIAGGNGIVDAKVDQYNDQDNTIFAG